jgi:hypothetical protein
VSWIQEHVPVILDDRGGNFERHRVGAGVCASSAKERSGTLHLFMRTLHCFNRSFQMHAAGAFDQDHVAGLEILLEPATGSFGIGQKERADATDAGGSG